MKKIIVHSGISISDKCGKDLHPVDEVNRAIGCLEAVGDKPSTVYSNSTDFVMAVKYIGKKMGVETEFFLDGVSSGSDIEPLFADFNRSLDMINQLAPQKNNTMNISLHTGDWVWLLVAVLVLIIIGQYRTSKFYLSQWSYFEGMYYKFHKKWFDGLPHEEQEKIRQATLLKNDDII